MKYIQECDRNIDYYILRTFLENHCSDTELLADNILRYFMRKYFSDADKTLLEISLKKNTTQEEFDEVLADIDVAEGGYRLFLLAYIMKNNPQLNYSDYLLEKVYGTLRFYRFDYLDKMAHFKKVCQKFQEAGIKIMVIKGGAMKIYRPDFPRLSDDIDVLIPEKDFDKAKNIAKELGYNYLDCEYSIDLHIGDDFSTGIVDIHNRLDLTKENNGIYEDMFARATKTNVFNVDNIYLPCPEDLIFISFFNLSTHFLQCDAPLPTALYSVLDFQYFLNTKPDFNWDIIKQNAVKTNTEAQFHFAMVYINKFFQNKIPFIFEDEFKEKAGYIIYNKWFLDKTRNKSQSYKLKRIIKTFLLKIKEYICFKIQYFLCKIPFIKENFAVKKLILQNQRLIK